MAIAEEPKEETQAEEERDRDHLGRDIRPCAAFEDDTAYNSQKVGQGEDAADGLRPFGHAAEGEHESGQQKGWQKEEKGHLDGLQLVLGKG